MRAGDSWRHATVLAAAWHGFAVPRAGLGIAMSRNKVVASDRGIAWTMCPGLRQCVPALVALEQAFGRAGREGLLDPAMRSSDPEIQSMVVQHVPGASRYER
jgi:hypothetical protein